ncbi:MAG: NAD-dependent epimerase/dehydratase family protein [Leptolinea sp.]|nr:NAD-dependent epimerase/dehydratase family protein [Leptolinea sp.]
MKSHKNVVLGSGPLGLAVVKDLYERNESVCLVNRSGYAPVPDSVEVVSADLYDSGRAFDVIKGSDTVYMCASPSYSGWEEKYPPLVRSVITGVQYANARLVFADNANLHGKVNGTIFEDTPINPLTRKSRIRARIAGELISAHAAGDLDVTIGRGSDFFGPNVKNSYLGERIFLPLLKGKTTHPIGIIDHPHTFTYINDFGKALVILGEHPETSGHLYHVPNSETQSTRTVLEMVFALAGMPVKIKPMDVWITRINSLFIPDINKIIERAGHFDHPFVVDGTLFSRTFGLSATLTESALRSTIEWYRDIPEFV